MTTHTPGPWKHVANTSFIGTDEDDPQTVAYVDDHRNRRARSRSESNANARLIAAAPELLEAVEWMIPTFEEMESMDVLNEAQRTALEIARAAIAKAKGE